MTPGALRGSTKLLKWPIEEIPSSFYDTFVLNTTYRGCVLVISLKSSKLRKDLVEQFGLRDKCKSLETIWTTVG